MSLDCCCQCSNLRVESGEDICKAHAIIERNRDIWCNCNSVYVGLSASTAKNAVGGICVDGLCVDDNLEAGTSSEYIFPDSGDIISTLAKETKSCLSRIS